MERFSIDVMEDVLGTSLFSRNWTARSVAEIDELDPVDRVPVISEMQYREIHRRLREHWDAAWQFPDAQNDYLLVCPA